MSRWVKITIEDVASYQAGALVKALESKAKYSEAQENPLEAAIERITSRIKFLANFPARLLRLLWNLPSRA